VSVLVFLGIPLLAGFLTRTFGEKAKGRDWYENTFLPKIGPWSLYGLLFTIVLLFAMQGDAITSQPVDVARMAVPLLLYFVLMFLVSFYASKMVGLNYAKSTSVAFTASGNNFELAIAVAIGTFGITSGQALAGVVGPLIEVPVLVGLVYVALWLGPKLFPGDSTVPTLRAATTPAKTGAQVHDCRTNRAQRGIRLCQKWWQISNGCRLDAPPRCPSRHQRRSPFRRHPARGYSQPTGCRGHRRGRG